MKHIAPSYYTAFRCTAGACKHNCCIGWDIGIDKDTAAYYRTVTGELGKRLCAHIAVDEDGDAYFQTDDDGRCPFLNENGLCDIIATLGEEALCQICSDHPRYRRDLSDRVEIGLGLCCEEAASIMINRCEPFSLTVLSNDDDDEPLCEEDSLFLQERDALLALATDRTKPLTARENEILAAVGHEREPLTAKQFEAIYRPLERLDPVWDQTLDLLKRDVPPSDTHDHAFEQILCYFLYRHGDADTLDSAAAFAVHSVRLLKRLFAAGDSTTERLCELCRQYSAEIEYSAENVQTLLSVF